MVGSYCFSSYGVVTPSVPWVLSLKPPVGTLCSVQWLAESFYLCNCKALAGPLSTQLYQAPFSKHFLASTIMLEFDDSLSDESQGGTVSMSFPFILCSAACFYTCSSEYFVPLSKKDQRSHTLVFLFLELCVVYEFYLEYSELLG